jgi:hypothetical protein
MLIRRHTSDSDPTPTRARTGGPSSLGRLRHITRSRIGEYPLYLSFARRNIQAPAPK